MSHSWDAGTAAIRDNLRQICTHRTPHWAEGMIHGVVLPLSSLEGNNLLMEHISMQEMASRHRVRQPCLQIIKTATVPAALCKRENIKQFHNSKIKFPLTRRIAR